MTFNIKKLAIFKLIQINYLLLFQEKIWKNELILKNNLKKFYI